MRWRSGPPSAARSSHGRRAAAFAWHRRRAALLVCATCGRDGWLPQRTCFSSISESEAHLTADARFVAQGGVSDYCRSPAGTGLALDEAIALAFGTATARAPRAAGLTEREAEIVRLVADGLPNKTIASQLHLSVRTVESDVRHALARAGLDNRTQLATWARRRLQ